MSDRAVSPFPAEATNSTVRPGSARARHISRSAAKRESVQLLGSIKDLQIRFSQVGVEHRRGAGAGIRAIAAICEDKEEEENRPPPGEGLSVSSLGEQRRPWKNVEMKRMDLAEARAEARSLIDKIQTTWSGGMTTVDPNEADTRSVLVSTAKAVRRVRSIVLVVSHTSGSRVMSLTSGSSKKDRPALSTPSRPAPLPRVGETRSSTIPDEAASALKTLRTAALDVLAALRGLEEALRIWPSSILLPDIVASPIDESSSSSSSSGSTPVPITYFKSGSEISERLMDTVMDYDEDWSVNALVQEEEKPHMSWEEVLEAEQRDYRPLREAEDRLSPVQGSIKTWIRAAEGIICREVDDGMAEQLPLWAQQAMENRPQERLRAFLVDHLPSSLTALLPPTENENSHKDLLMRLSDGFLLVQAFNVQVANSARSWGFIAAEDVHDTLSAGLGSLLDSGDSETTSKKEKDWTFRRVENLSAWILGIRSRFHLPIILANTETATMRQGLPAVSGAHIQQRAAGPSPHMEPKLAKTHSTVREAKTAETKVVFDPLSVAKQTGDWETMLSTATSLWMNAAAAELHPVDRKGSTAGVYHTISESEVV